MDTDEQRFFFAWDLIFLVGVVAPYSHIGGFANWYKIKEMAIRIVNDG